HLVRNDNERIRKGREALQKSLHRPLHRIIPSRMTAPIVLSAEQIPEPDRRTIDHHDLSLSFQAGQAGAELKRLLDRLPGGAPLLSMPRDPLPHFVIDRLRRGDEAPTARNAPPLLQSKSALAGTRAAED